MARRARKKKPVRTIVKNYGLMWERDRVFWGGPGDEGTLLGSSRARKKIDFREQIGIYVLYDHGMKPIYVGQAGRGNARLFHRLKQHKKGNLSKRWAYFTWFGLLSVNKSRKLSGRDEPTKGVRNTLGGALDEIEAVLIAAVEPPFNKQGSRFLTTEYFRQEDDERLESQVDGQMRGHLDKLYNDVCDDVADQLAKSERRLEKTLDKILRKL
jgi:hypothetical protein